MSREPLYQRVGREPMTDAELDEAIAEWRRDNPGEPSSPTVEARLRRLDKEARVKRGLDAEASAVLAEAEAKGLITTEAAVVDAIRAKRQREAGRASADRHARNVEVAEMLVGRPKARRGPGSGWNPVEYRRYFRDALDRGSLPDDAPLASVAEFFRPLGQAEPGISVRRLQELDDRFGRGH